MFSTFVHRMNKHFGLSAMKAELIFSVKTGGFRYCNSLDTNQESFSHRTILLIHFVCFSPMEAPQEFRNNTCYSIVYLMIINHAEGKKKGLFMMVK